MIQRKLIKNRYLSLNLGSDPKVVFEKGDMFVLPIKRMAIA